MSQQGCVEVPMLILPYPQGGVVADQSVQRWTVSSLVHTHEFRTRTSEYLQYSCSGA